MSHVLFLTQVLPYPLHSGAKIRAYYVLRHLARSHEVTLVSFVREDDEPEAVAHLERFCRAVHPVRMRRSALRDGRALVKSLLTGVPVVIARDKIGEMEATVRRLAQAGGFDVVHADQTSMVQYALQAREWAGRAPRLVLDAHNALYRVPERMARHQPNGLRRALFRREARALQRYERAAYGQFDHVVFVTEVDRRELLQPSTRRAQGGKPATASRRRRRSNVSTACPEASGELFEPPVEGLQGLNVPTASSQPSTCNLQPATSVIPICVDPDEKPLIERRPDPRAVTHLGTMFWPPNVEGVLWFAREVWPRVVDQVPGVRFTVIGKDPPREVRELPARVRRVDVTGYVPDPEPYLAETAVFVVPLRAGGGMRVKIVDAWCWGVPVVSTSIGAEGIAAEEGRHVLVADEPAALADAVVRVLRDPALGRRLRENARRWVEERYDWRQVYGEWDEVYDGLA
ncbi:MAG: glycosyltransferase family 4 protein [Chloroflexota bacterium]|nr:glycosyltransferase family 4 protein [Chloroflexota bacterium]